MRWIKIRDGLMESRAVAMAARRLQVGQGEAFAQLVRALAWIDAQMDGDGQIAGVELADLDVMVARPAASGFGDLLAEIGWLVQEDAGLRVVDPWKWFARRFDRGEGPESPEDRRRRLSREASARHRAKQSAEQVAGDNRTDEGCDVPVTSPSVTRASHLRHANVTDASRECHAGGGSKETRAQTREEKKRKESPPRAAALAPVSTAPVSDAAEGRRPGGDQQGEIGAVRSALLAWSGLADTAVPVDHARRVLERIRAGFTAGDPGGEGGGRPPGDTAALVRAYAAGPPGGSPPEWPGSLRAGGILGAVAERVARGEPVWASRRRTSAAPAWLDEMFSGSAGGSEGGEA